MILAAITHMAKYSLWVYVIIINSCSCDSNQDQMRQLPKWTKQMRRFWAVIFKFSEYFYSFISSKKVQNFFYLFLQIVMPLVAHSTGMFGRPPARELTWESASTPGQCWQECSDRGSGSSTFIAKMSSWPIRWNPVENQGR